MEISHREFITVLKDKDKQEQIKENERNGNGKYEIITWSSIKSKISMEKIVVYFTSNVEV